MTIVVAVAWPLLVIAAAGDQYTPEWADVWGKSTFCGFTLIWIAAQLRAQIPNSALVPITLGTLALFIGGTADLLDEFFVMDSGAVILAENAGRFGGALLITIGAFWWMRLTNREVEELEASTQKFAALSITDPLTGLFNRAHMSECLDQHLGGLVPDRPVSLLMLDIDDFKQHNDRWGHPEGDTVIATLADVIRDSIRSTDVAFRYGGEEFAVLLPGADLERARIAAERIRVAFSLRVFRPEGGVEVRKTVSLGVARAQVGDHADRLVERADEALYVAERGGKDRVVAA